MTHSDTIGHSAGAPTHPSQARPLTGAGLGGYLAIGMYFGVVATKVEVVSWFRIQEMFRFQAFHMYGIIGSAVAVAMLSVALLKARRARTVRGDTIVLPPKEFGQNGYRYWMGGRFSASAGYSPARARARSSR